MEVLLPASAAVYRGEHQAPRGVKSTIRRHRIRIATGHEVEVSSPYYKPQVRPLTQKGLVV